MQVRGVSAQLAARRGTCAPSCRGQRTRCPIWYSRTERDNGEIVLDGLEFAAITVVA
jgi:hypothetical protein